MSSEFNKADQPLFCAHFANGGQLFVGNNRLASFIVVISTFWKLWPIAEQPTAAREWIARLEHLTDLIQAIHAIARQCPVGIRRGPVSRHEPPQYVPESDTIHFSKTVGVQFRDRVNDSIVLFTMVRPSASRLVS